MAAIKRNWKISAIVLPLLAVSAILVIGMGPGGKSGGYHYAVLSFDEDSSPTTRVWTLDYPDRREVVVGGAKEMRFELKMTTPIGEIRDRHILNTLGSKGWKLTATTRTKELGKYRCNLIFTRI